MNSSCCDTSFFFIFRHEKLIPNHLNSDVVFLIRPYSGGDPFQLRGLIHVAQRHEFRHLVAYHVSFLFTSSMLLQVLNESRLVPAVP